VAHGAGLRWCLERENIGLDGVSKEENGEISRRSGDHKYLQNKLGATIFGVLMIAREAAMTRWELVVKAGDRLRASKEFGGRYDRGVARRGVAPCGARHVVARRGEGRIVERKGLVVAACVRHSWLCLVAARTCVGGGLARSFVDCGGDVAWVRLKVDVDGSGGGEGGGRGLEDEREENERQWWGKQ
jgi:hypothetical protein